MDDLRARPHAAGTLAPRAFAVPQTVAPRHRVPIADGWRLLAEQAPGRRVPGTLVISAGVTGIAAVDLMIRDRAPLAALILLLAVVVAGTAVYRVTARLALPRTFRLLAVAAVLAVPLAAPWPGPGDALLLAGAAGSAAGLAHWASSARRFSGGEIAVFAGIPATLVVLTGSSGRAFVGLGLAVVVARCIVDRRRLRRTAVMLAGYGTLPALALGAWTWRTGALPAGASWTPLWLLAGVVAAACLVALLLRRSR
jgi:hypothetical protein